MKRVLRLGSAVLSSFMIAMLFLPVPLSAGAEEYYAAGDYYYATGLVYYEGSLYYIMPDGEKATGWVSVYDRWYYFNPDGTAVSGWLTHKGTRYYLGFDGVMATGWQLIDGNWYYFNPDGGMATGWVHCVSDNYWYYLNRDGKMDPNIKESADWMLILINRWNPVPEDYTLRLKTMPSGYQLDERIIDSLGAMLSAARAQGLSPVITSAYRTVARQQVLFNNKTAEMMRTGLAREQAEYEASRVVACPGYSEHNIGLAVDIVSAGYRYLNELQESTPEMIWLVENCAEYGFILRYPPGKEDITGVIYEPWHFRYVGVNAAREIMSRGITLEEYLGR